MSEEILTYDPKKKRNVRAGYYNPDYKIFIKICLPEHFMIKENAYAIQETVIQMLKIRGCGVVLIHTKTMKLTSDFEDWWKRKPKDYGHGLQRFLPIGTMRRIK